MTAETVTWVWLIAGLSLMAAELVLPGLIAVFLGLAAIVVAGARWVGLVEGLAPSFTLWFISSILLVLSLRGLLRRLMPGQVERGQTDEDVEAFGKVVLVVDAVDQEAGGRVRFAGTSWKARTLEGTIPAGQKARIVYRDNVAFVVEPAPEAELSESPDGSNEHKQQASDT